MVVNNVKSLLSSTSGRVAYCNKSGRNGLIRVAIAEDDRLLPVELTQITATQAAADITRGLISAEDYTGACLDRIAAVESEVQAFAHLDRDHALSQARALDRHKASGGRIGPLHGIPVGIKDIIDTKDFPTECGALAMAGRRPDTDAAVVARLREAGAVIIGKTVTAELAYFHPGKTRNPRDLSRTPGGSSSGSAAAVAAGMVPLAIGAQTNGSLIRPAAFCGVFAIKPSHGMVSRAGVLTLSRTLDHVGAFSRSIDDLALVMDVIAGLDPEDPDSRPYATPDFRAVAAEEPPIAPRFAFVRTPVWDKADDSTRAALEDLAKEIGAPEVELPPALRAAWDAHRAIMAADMAHNLGAIVDRGGEVSQAFRELIAEGRTVTAAQYLAAVRDGRRYAESLAGIFEQLADAIITPSARGVAPQGLQTTGDPAFCTFWTLTGLPSLNLPVLADADNLPIGVQLVGAAGRDARLLRTANWLMANLGSA
jgi:Asp-tRNA(Asn)/Glu-tRNA(Gln) amidotransferase A subunit family amidase